MIKAFTASPKKFDEMDFEHIGSGANVLRYAFGVHLGEKETAVHYLDTYRDYSEADQSFTLDGRLIGSDSPAQEVAEFLVSTPDSDAAKEKFADNAFALKAIDSLTDDDDGLLFQTQRGVLYEAAVPGIDQDDLPHWNDPVETYTLNRVAVAFYDRTLDLDALDKASLEALKVGTNHDDFESLMDDIFDQAFNQGLEEDLIELGVKDELREIFWTRVRGDSRTQSNYDDEFDEGIDDRYMNLVSGITGKKIDMEQEMTYGDIYDNLAHAFNPWEENIEKNTEGKRQVSAFLAEDIDIAGFRAPTIFGRHGADEIIITSERVASSIKLQEVNPTDSYEAEEGYDL